ncbi:hypothetical protein [Peptoniphilus grossensis]|uniref:Uncharacterized protein n=1 Tax=Peptoniphilus grossensis TaxID=1465756 RepID=A0ABU7XCQ4_9FIRM
MNKVKTSALRRWLVSLGLIARDQTTRLTGGYDCDELKIFIGRIKLKIFFEKSKLIFYWKFKENFIGRSKLNFK